MCLFDIHVQTKFVPAHQSIWKGFKLTKKILTKILLKKLQEL